MEVSVNGKTVTATIQLDEGRPAATRKSTIMFTTNGYVPIGNGMRISINIIAPNDKGAGQAKCDGVIAPSDKGVGRTKRHQTEQEKPAHPGDKVENGSKTKKKNQTTAIKEENGNLCAHGEGDRAQPERPGRRDVERPGRSKT